MIRAITATRESDMATANRAAEKYRPIGERDARFEDAIFRTVEAACPAVVVPPFETIKLPRGVVVSFIRTDGSVFRTANIG
jgi:hypothetical protein